MSVPRKMRSRTPEQQLRRKLKHPNSKRMSLFLRQASASGGALDPARVYRSDGREVEELANDELSLSRRLQLALWRVFLPLGYPTSVHPGYAKFQIFDSTQAACSYVRGTITAQMVFKSIGVGDETATAAAAAVTWMLRDGASMAGSLLFTSWGAPFMEEHIKALRLFADVAVDVGLTLEMCAPMCGPFLPAVLCLAKICMGLCGVAAGATRTSITAHFATHDNVADVAAKESSQETAVTLVGLLMGIFMTTYVRLTLPQAWGVFVLLTVVHLVCNYLAVTSLQFNSLSANLAGELAFKFLNKSQPAVDPNGVDLPYCQDDVDLTPGTMSKLDRLWPWGRWHPTGLVGALSVPRRCCSSEPAVALDFGCSVSSLSFCCEEGGGRPSMAEVLWAFKEERFAVASRVVSTPVVGFQYVLVVCTLAPNNRPEDRLKALLLLEAFRCELVSGFTRVPSQAQLKLLLLQARTTADTRFPGFLQTVCSQGWALHRSTLGSRRYTVCVDGPEEEPENGAED